MSVRWWAFGAGLLLLVLAIVFLIGARERGEELRLYTSPPLPPTNKRVQVLVPADWEAQTPISGIDTVWLESPRSFPWLGSRLIRNWLKLDEGGERGVLALVLMETQAPPHGAPPYPQDGAWKTIWSIRRGPLVAGVSYSRTGKEAFDRSYQAMKQSTRIID